MSNSLLSPLQQKGHSLKIKPLATSLRRSNNDGKDMNMRDYDTLHQNMISNNIEGEELYSNEETNLSTKNNRSQKTS